jgi:hypothetical protein
MRLTGLVLRDDMFEGDDTIEATSDSDDTVEIVVEVEMDGSKCIKRPLLSRAGIFLGASLIAG